MVHFSLVADVQCLENRCCIYFVCFLLFQVGGQIRFIKWHLFLFLIMDFWYGLCFKLAVNFYHMQMILISLYSSYYEYSGLLGISEHLLGDVSIPTSLCPLTQDYRVTLDIKQTYQPLYQWK